MLAKGAQLLLGPFRRLITIRFGTVSLFFSWKGAFLDLACFGKVRNMEGGFPGSTVGLGGGSGLGHFREPVTIGIGICGGFRPANSRTLKRDQTLL